MVIYFPKKFNKITLKACAFPLHILLYPIIFYLWSGTVEDTIIWLGLSKGLITFFRYCLQIKFTHHKKNTFGYNVLGAWGDFLGAIFYTIQSPVDYFGVGS